MNNQSPITITDFTAAALLLVTAPLRLVAWVLGTVLSSLHTGFTNGWQDVK